MYTTSINLLVAHTKFMEEVKEMQIKFTHIIRGYEKAYIK